MIETGKMKISEVKTVNILFVDACPRKMSRSRKLAEAVLAHLEGEVTQVRLTEIEIPEVDENVVEKRSEDAKRNDYSDKIYDLAKQFAEADTIVMAAPYWDLSFPALLKRYIEAITVSGITFSYTEEGIPVGLCKATQLFYVTTAGGPIFNEEYGYGYVRTLAQAMYGIEECRCFKAENLDVIGTDVAAVLAAAEKDIEVNGVK